MKKIEEKFDSIVVGAGHAGCEAALALSRTGNKTLLLTISLDAIAHLACNPSIGGTAKGQIVSEVDALGGEMGKIADKTAIQIRVLNRGKGPAVQSLRAQSDKNAYHCEMKKVLENQENLFIKQAEVQTIEISDKDKIITTAMGISYSAKSIVFATGVYLKSEIIVGEYKESIGPNNFKNSMTLSDSLTKLGINLFRFKTGTPMRIHARSADFSKMEIQEGDDFAPAFSYVNEEKPQNKTVCYLTYTTNETHQIIRDNFDKAPSLSGEIKGVGPRYCPSIETKVERFADRERHQLFLEPEAENTQEMYLQGFSTSMPADIQKQMIRSVIGLENAEIMRDAYAIEYDCIDPTQLSPTLELKTHPGLFFAGQINGTSGYEEAAGQGLVAGINANLFNKQKPQLVLKRNDGYIGVLIDDIVTKGTQEPYRMMTSRAEYRLLLRQDNADMRLTQIGRDVGLVDENRWQKFCDKKAKLADLEERLLTKVIVDETMQKLYEESGESIPKESQRYRDMLKRTNIDIFLINKYYPFFADNEKSLAELVNIKIKYEGYIKQQEEEIEKMLKNERVEIPADFDYANAKGLRVEAIEKFLQIKPLNLGQASRISGVSPADVSVLSILIKK